MRGSLGMTFRKMVCVTRMETCDGCLLRFHCPYPRFFEPFAPPGHPFARRLSQFPRPFALEVPAPSASPVRFAEGDLLSFKMTLWGRTSELLPYLVVAVNRALSRGIGREVRADLVRVVAEVPGMERVAFSDGVLETSLPEVSADQILSARGGEVRRLRVVFLSPVRADVGGRLQHPVDFPALIRAANERGRAVFWAYGGREPPWDGRMLVRDAEKVQTVETEQSWLDLSRFSRRQGVKLKIGGVLGWAVFGGDDLSPFIPLLRFAEWVHVGKLATMGLGQISVSEA